MATHPARRRLTVGMVTFNAATVVERALESILQHRSPALELVVMDGGSTDGTQDILRRHGEAINLWRSEPDRGIYDAMNKVCQAANGDWLLFIGADDELVASPQALLAAMAEPDAVYYGNVRIRSSGRISGGPFSRYRLMQENICHQAVLYPRAVYRGKSYDIHSGMLADHRYNIELFGSGIGFHHLDQVVSCFDDGGRSGGGDPAFERIKLAAIRHSFGWPWYAAKCGRNALVKLLKPHHGAD